MPMTTDEVSRAVAWQETHEGLRECEICKGQMKVDSEIVSLSSLYIKQDEQPLPKTHLPQTKTFRLMAVTCASCGQVKLFDASVAGVMS